MKRALIILVAIAVLAPAAHATTRSARAARGATVDLRSTRVGRILVNSRGFTLYMFTADRSRHDSCVSIRGCASVWPVLASRRPTAGKGVKASLLGTIRIAGAVSQVTYAGHPLYTYVGDSGPGQTSYVGIEQFGGFWYGVNAAGGAVR